MDKKILIGLIIITLIIIGVIGIYFLTNNKSNLDFKVLDNLADLKNDKNTILQNENNKFYEYENEKYIVFKIRESTYTSSIDIKSVKLTNINYNDDTLNIELKIDIVEGEADPLRDWPLVDEKYIVLKVNNKVEKLYINGYEYTKI